MLSPKSISSTSIALLSTTPSCPLPLSFPGVSSSYFESPFCPSSYLHTIFANTANTNAADAPLPPDTQPADCHVAVSTPQAEDAAGTQGNSGVESSLRRRHALTMTSPPRVIPLPRATPHRPRCLTARTATDIQQTPEHCQHGGAAHASTWISLYIKIEKRKRKKSNFVGSYG